MLVEGSTYENKKRFSPESREIRKVSLEGYKGKIRDKNGKVAFIYDCGRCHIAVSALELARALYLHNTHFTRTALRPNGLRGLATVQEGQNASTITFHKLSDFPASSLRSRSTQAHLIWLLFDEAASRGFNSIYESLLQCKEPEWSFDFAPPSLKGWVAKVAMSVEKEDEDIPYVGEITAIHNPSFEYQNEVNIRHPSLKDTVRVNPEDKARPVVVKPDQDSQLNLESIPKVGRRRDVVSEAGFKFTFGSDITSKLAPEKQEQKISPAVMSDGKKAPEKTGVGHASNDGISQELDFGINRSEESSSKELKDAEGTSRFTLFEEVITQLTSLEGYQNIATKCLELPEPIGHRKAYTNQVTGKPRVCHAAFIRYFGLPLLIVEVDMDDYPPKRTLSTRVFGFRNDA